MLLSFLCRSRRARSRQQRHASLAAKARELRLQQHGSLCVHVKRGSEIASKLPCFVAVRVPQSGASREDTSGSKSGSTKGRTKRYRTVSRLAPDPQWDQYIEVSGVLNVLASQPLRIEVFEEYCEGDGGARVAPRRRSVVGSLFVPPASNHGASSTTLPPTAPSAKTKRPRTVPVRRRRRPRDGGAR
jgi:hypothetical protein